MCSKPHDQEWDASFTSAVLPHPPPSFPALRLPIHPAACPQSGSMAHFYSPYYAHHSLLAATTSTAYKSPVFKFSPVVSRGSPPRSMSPASEPDRRTTSIAALRIKAREHSASFGYLSSAEWTLIHWAHMHMLICNIPWKNACWRKSTPFVNVLLQYQFLISF